MHVTEHDLGMVGGHVEGPVVVGDLEAGRVGPHEERGDALRVAGLPGRAREHDVVLRDVHPRVEALGAVQHPVVTLPDRSCLQPGCIAAVSGLG